MNGRHVVFGVILEGYDVIDTIQNTPTTSNDKPLKDVVIKNSGELEFSGLLEVPKEGVQFP